MASPAPMMTRSTTTPSSSHGHGLSTPQNGQQTAVEPGTPTLRDPLARQLLPDAKYSRINRWRSEIDPTDVVCSCSERLELWRSSISTFGGTSISLSTRKSASGAAGGPANVSSLCAFCHRVRDSAEQQQSSAQSQPHHRRWQKAGKRPGLSSYYPSYKSSADASPPPVAGVGDVGVKGESNTAAPAGTGTPGTGTGIGGGGGGGDGGSTTVDSRRTTSFIKRFFHRRTTSSAVAAAESASSASGLPSRLGRQPPSENNQGGRGVGGGGTQMYRQDEADDEASGSSVLGGAGGGGGGLSDSDKGNRKPKLGVDDSAARLRRAQKLLDAQQRKEKG